jgi:hypothetical protein
MYRSLTQLVVRHWRVGLALASVVAFALAGSASEPMPM